MKRKVLVLLALIVLAALIIFVMKERRSRATQNSQVTISSDGQIVVTPPERWLATIVANPPKATNSNSTKASAPNAK
jgi:Tfp pilus assembly protein PilX